MREKIEDQALKESELSPRELTVRFTDTERYFVSEASVYRILKSYDPIASPAYGGRFRWGQDRTARLGMPHCRKSASRPNRQFGLF